MEASNSLWSAWDAYDLFWHISRNPPKNVEGHLGENWPEQIYIATGTIVWDPDLADLCPGAEKSASEDEDDWEHSDDCDEFMCGVAGHERWQWLDDTIAYDHQWLGTSRKDMQLEELGRVVFTLVPDTTKLHNGFTGSLAEWSEYLYGRNVFAYPRAV